MRAADGSLCAISIRSRRRARRCRACQRKGMKTMSRQQIGFGLLAAAFLAAGTLVIAQVPAGAAPAPVVTSVTPAADTTGSHVVVSGSNLTLPPKLLPTAIFFGTVKAKVNSCAPLTGAASSCNVTVPPQCPGAPKRVDVRVIVGNLESAVSSGDGFTYTDSGKPGPSCPSPSPSPSSSSPSPSPSSSSPSPSPSSASPSPSPSSASPSPSPSTSPAPVPTPVSTTIPVTG
jgi:hypothetical protein